MFLQRTPFIRTAFVSLILLEFQFWLFNLNVSSHFFHIFSLIGFVYTLTAQITVESEWKLINDTSIQVLHSKSISPFIHLLSSTISNSCSNYISMLLLSSSLCYSPVNGWHPQWTACSLNIIQQLKKKICVIPMELIAPFN